MVTLVLRPMRIAEIQIMCLFILYTPQTVLSILSVIWNKASLYVIVLCPCSKTRVSQLEAKYNRLYDIEASCLLLRSLRASMSYKKFYLASNLYIEKELSYQTNITTTGLQTKTQTNRINVLL